MELALALFTTFSSSIFIQNYQVWSLRIFSWVQAFALRLGCCWQALIKQTLYVIF
jgi:hypothetical protein